MSKKLGLDVGDKYIGLAISDESATISRGLETILRKSINEDLTRIKNIVSENNVKEIVVGLPLNLNGSIGDQTKKVLSFVNHLRKNLRIPINTWDERLTTVKAAKIMISADVSRRKRKKSIDKLSAVIILQDYINSLRRDES
ncbi:MAG: Holliday junction resolvase RuvX [Actinobacteria bacterium]|nr:Holliday junction resolvase RuvX [Actinomycetota bacterium]